MQLSEQLHAFIWQSTTGNNCNTYLIDGPTRILIDPGHINAFEHVRSGLDELGLEISDIGLIICTHSHPDHIEAAQLFRQSSAHLTFHEEEWKMVKSMEKYLNSSLRKSMDSVTPDFFLKEGDLAVDGLELGIFHTPGHSPGSISVYWTEQKALFTGDLIFKDGIGRTDLPLGNGEELKESIKRLSALEVEFMLPGHGDIVTGIDDVKRNFERVEKSWFDYI